VDIAPATAIAVGSQITCALHRDGSLSCWGGNERGRVPITRVTEIRGARAVAAGGVDVCVATEASGVWCMAWYGQRHGPRRVDGSEGVSTLEALGLGEFVGWSNDGTAVHWTSNMINDSVRAAEPAEIEPELAYTSMEHCVKRQGAFVCESKFHDHDQTVLARNVRVACGGQSHGCLQLEDGSVDCWGEMWGEIGGPEERLSLRRVAFDERVTDLACGGSHTCALLESRHVACWGERGNGDLGDGTVGRFGEPLTITIPASR
jgi:alpha-tubulin suppressor-like RCC1 family protein